MTKRALLTYFDHAEIDARPDPDTASRPLCKVEMTHLMKKYAALLGNPAAAAMLEAAAVGRWERRDHHDVDDVQDAVSNALAEDQRAFVAAVEVVMGQYGGVAEEVEGGGEEVEVPWLEML